MNMVRKQTLRKFEDLYAEPPPYTSQSSSAEAASSISGLGGPSTSRVPATDELNFEPSPLEIPTPAECFAHLKLLHAFAKLRHDVGNRDGLFGIRMEKSDSRDESSRRNGETSSVNGEQQPDGVHEQNTSQAAIDSHTPESTTSFAERIRDKRWSVFVTKAVARFEKWWEQLAYNSSIWYTPIRLKDFETPAGSNEARSKFFNTKASTNLKTCSQQLRHRG